MISEQVIKSSEEQENFIRTVIDEDMSSLAKNPDTPSQAL